MEGLDRRFAGNGNPDAEHSLATWHGCEFNAAAASLASLRLLRQLMFEIGKIAVRMLSYDGELGAESLAKAKTNADLSRAEL